MSQSAEQLEDVREEVREAQDSLYEMQKLFTVISQVTRSIRTTGGKAPLPSVIYYLHANEVRALQEAVEKFSACLRNITLNIAEMDHIL